MSSSIIDPGLRFAANQMLTLLRKDITKITQFTTDFTADAVTKGTTMLIPIVADESAGEFAVGTNDYGTIDGSFRFTPMTFNHHPKHSFGFTPSDQTNIGLETINAMTKAGELSARAVGRAIAESVVGLIDSTTVPVTGTDKTEWYDADGNEIKKGNAKDFKFTAANRYCFAKGELTKMQVAKFRQAANAADIPVSQTILALCPEKFAELLSLLTAEMYGGTEAIRGGFIPGLYGWKGVMEVNELSDDDGMIGALIPETAVAVASRLPGVLNPHLYQNLGTATDDASGMVFQFRQGGDWKTDHTVASVDCIFGAKLVQPTKIVRLCQDDLGGGHETHS